MSKYRTTVKFRFTALIGILAILPLFLLSLSPAVGADPRAERQFDFSKGEPFEFIAYLIRQEERGLKTIQIPDAPKVWIKEEHLRLLVLLLDSNEPCASVGSFRSSRIPTERDQRPSTVGHEAAYMIESYRHGLFPKYAVNTSVDIELDRAALKKWWADLQK